MAEQFYAQKDGAKFQLVARFVGQIARATRHHQQLSQEERRNLVAEYAELLMRRGFPGYCYDMNGLDFVLNGLEWFPSLNTLAGFIENYDRVVQMRQRNASNHLRIEGTAERDLSEDERQWLRFWQNGESTGWVFAPAETSIEPEKRDRRRDNSLSLIKQQAPYVWRSLTGNYDDKSNDWQDAQHIRQEVRELADDPMKKTLMSMLRAALERHAPQNLALLDEEPEERTAA